MVEWFRIQRTNPHTRENLTRMEVRRKLYGLEVTSTKKLFMIYRYAPSDDKKEDDEVMQYLMYFHGQMTKWKPYKFRAHREDCVRKESESEFPLYEIKVSGKLDPAIRLVRPTLHDFKTKLNIDYVILES